MKKFLSLLLAVIMLLGCLPAMNVLGTDYDGFSIDYYGTIYNYAITEDGLLMDYFGMVRTYEAE